MSNKKKRYTSEQKLTYHSSRDKAPGRYGLKYGGPKHCYSFGFTDAFSGRNNEQATRNEFGNRSANAYAVGYKRGRKAAAEYHKRTGKQLFN